MGKMCQTAFCEYSALFKVQQLLFVVTVTVLVSTLGAPD